MSPILTKTQTDKISKLIGDGRFTGINDFVAGADPRSLANASIKQEILEACPVKSKITMIEFLHEVYAIRDTFSLMNFYIKKTKSLLLSEICTTEFVCPSNKVGLRDLKNKIESSGIGTIVYLDLSWNGFMETDLPHITDISKAFKIKYLNLAGNRIMSVPPGENIKSLLSVQSLKFVDLCGNQLASTDGNPMFDELHKNNEDSLLKIIFIIDSWAGETDLDWGQLMMNIHKDFKMKIIDAHKAYKKEAGTLLSQDRNQEVDDGSQEVGNK